MLQRARQIAPEIRALLGGLERLGQGVEDRRVDRVIELAPLLSPIQQALVADDPEQPGLGIPDAFAIVVDQGDQRLLEDVLRVLQGNPVMREKGLQAWPDLLEKTL